MLIMARAILSRPSVPQDPGSLAGQNLSIKIEDSGMLASTPVIVPGECHSKPMGWCPTPRQTLLLEFHGPLLELRKEGQNWVTKSRAEQNSCGFPLWF